MNKIKEFINQVIRKDTAESTKRIGALLITITIVILSFIYTNEENWIASLTILSAFVLSLLGVAAIEDVQKAKTEKKAKQDSGTQDLVP